MSAWYVFGYNLSQFVARIFFRFRVVHRERIIQEGPVILAMNHESYLDPPFAGIACRRAIYFLARKTLLDLPLLGPILPKLNVIPVDQEGTDHSALKALIKILRANECVLVFPEGSRTPDGNLQPALPGVGFVIAKTLAPVVPLRIVGAHRALPRGGGKLRFTRITIVVGEPLYFTAEEVRAQGREAYARISQRVMDAIAELHLE